MAGIPAGYLGVMNPNPSTAMLVQRTVAATESYVPPAPPAGTGGGGGGGGGTPAATVVPIGSPGTWVGTPPANIAALRALTPPAAAMKGGEYVVIGTGKGYTYAGTPTGWVQVTLGTKGAAAPATQFPAETTVTAEDAANAAKLTGLGFIAAPTTAWATGDGITVGKFNFHWSGTAWAPGGAP